jgi:CRP/FNR family transcriptional regulator, cyclic AMP receptor protein
VRAVDVTRVARLAPFKELTPSQQSMLARMLDDVHAPAGTTLVHDGDYGYELMIIEDGTVEVFRGGERIDEMGPGDFFGELAVLGDGARRDATIVSTSPVRILTLTAHYMREVRERLPAVGERIDRVIAARSHAVADA